MRYLWNQMVDVRGFGVCPVELETGYGYAIFDPSDGSNHESERPYQSIAQAMTDGQIEASLLGCLDYGIPGETCADVERFLGDALPLLRRGIHVPLP